MESIYDFSARALDGEAVDFERYRGQVLLIVNTASACGFTPQYEGLQQLHQRLAGRGLTVLGFPCNQFGRQEPGDAASIAEFCSMTYQVGFQMFEKIEVKGPNAHPLYRFLTSQAPGVLGLESIKWNFTKFLVDREGRVVERYASTTKPAAIEADIEKLL
jgi:glutathione peroxidase